MKEFTEDYLSTLNQLIDNKDEEQVRAKIEDLHPADIAELVGDLDDPDIRLRLMLSFKIMELLDGKRLENPREDDGSEKEDPLFLE